ncbi:MAG TPA: protein phosphatase 2C domain-containing protein [Isosphaeraceae bacterium]|nr:protein phosphatase 2C domain-containing protein [Isosphaeraceae bacterium]
MNWDDIIIDAAATDTGMRRSNNQDSYMAVRASHEESWRQRGHVFLVADGMGAHAVGELASKMACDLIPHTYMKARTGTPSEAIVKSFREVSAQIHSRASANRDFQGMGTTCSALLLLPTGALVAHVGDSRVYRIRKGRIDQLSFDHSLAWELVRRNHLTSEQASLSVPKNVITRSLGPEIEIEVDIEGPLAVELGDVYLLCSDGLSGPVDDDEMGAIAANFHPNDACRYLVSLANLRGGLDNITVVIVRIGEWVDPDSGETLNRVPTPKHVRDRSGREGWRSRLSELVTGRRRQGSLALVEDHPYRTAECNINETLVDRFDELTRNIQEQAIAQAWSLDWAALATLRRQATDARTAKNLWVSLRKAGELIFMLGQAARFYRKNAGPATPVQ